MSTTNRFRTLMTFLTGTIVAVAVATPALLRATTNPARTTYITFSGATALPGVALTPGTYVFELASPTGDTSIVRVSNRDRSRTYLTAFTRIVNRPSTLAARQMITFGEAAAGSPSTIVAWYPEGEGTGRQFIYPR